MAWNAAPLPSYFRQFDLSGGQLSSDMSDPMAGTGDPLAAQTPGMLANDTQSQLSQLQNQISQLISGSASQSTAATLPASLTANTTPASTSLATLPAGLSTSPTPGPTTTTTIPSGQGQYGISAIMPPSTSTMGPVLGGVRNPGLYPPTVNPLIG